MPNLGGDYAHRFETAVDVVWKAGRHDDVRGMGLELDELIVGDLRDRLSRSNTITLRPSRIRERRATM